LIAFTGVPGAAAQVQSGALRALGVTSPQRNSALPDVPTMAQAGLVGQEAETLMCVLVPAGTPKPVIARLHREIVAIVGLPDVRQKFAALGFDALAITPEESAERIAQELARWGRLIRDANIRAE
jgi:tripartite-type tricarboxylate transporter receptor subunit TctC